MSFSGRKRKMKQKSFSQLLGLDNNKPVIVMHPGDFKETKGWFPGQFAKLAHLLEKGCRIVITGSQG